MPPLVDPDILDQFRLVLNNWSFTGYVTVKDTALQWAERNLPGFQLKELARLMHEHVESGGVINQVVETRPEWNHWPYHYDFCMNWLGRAIYVETLLVDDDPRDPTIRIVSIHDV
jgi:hypothetical protein